jgi:hypothetical protein
VTLPSSPAHSSKSRSTSPEARNRAKPTREESQTQEADQQQADQREKESTTAAKGTKPRYEMTVEELFREGGAGDGPEKVFNEVLNRDPIIKKMPSDVLDKFEVIEEMRRLGPGAVGRLGVVYDDQARPQRLDLATLDSGEVVATQGKGAAKKTLYTFPATGHAHTEGWDRVGMHVRAHLRPESVDRLMIGETYPMAAKANFAPATDLNEAALALLRDRQIQGRQADARKLINRWKVSEGELEQYFGREFEKTDDPDALFQRISDGRNGSRGFLNFFEQGHKPHIQTAHTYLVVNHHGTVVLHSTGHRGPEYGSDQRKDTVMSVEKFASLIRAGHYSRVSFLPSDGAATIPELPPGKGGRWVPVTAEKARERVRPHPDRTVELSGVVTRDTEVDAPGGEKVIYPRGTTVRWRTILAGVGYVPDHPEGVHVTQTDAVLGPHRKVTVAQAQQHLSTLPLDQIWARDQD